MKKNIYFLIAAAALNGALMAQPVLTDVSCNPTIGEVFAVRPSNYVSPGSAGANQTWNLSTLSSTATANNTFVSVANTPTPGAFPNSNIAVTSDGSTYGYYNVGSTAWRNNGVYAGAIAISYTNAEDVMHYPFSFNNTYTDPWGGTFQNGGFTFHRSGNTTVTADGYGTLITPNATVTNVMRVHFVQVYKDSANPGAPIVTNYVNDQYIWFKPGNHYPVAAVYSVSVNGANPNTGGHYLNNIISSIEELSTGSSISLYPVPASEEITIGGDEFGENTEVNIYNVSGALVLSTSLSEKRVNVSTLDAGVYFIRLGDNTVSGKNLKFVIAR